MSLLNYQKYGILYVDDEAKSRKYCVHSFERKFQILTS